MSHEQRRLLAPAVGGSCAPTSAVSFGMWVFLVSEILLFSGLFAGYTVYRSLHTEGFLAAARETNIVYGTVNTAILMTSSLSLAVAGNAARAKSYLLAQRLLLVTMLLGTLFLILKGLEYREDIEKRLVPGSAFALPQQGAALFFAFYWMMTGIHAIHVSGGLAALGRLVIASRRAPTWLSGSGSEEAMSCSIADLDRLVLAAGDDLRTCLCCLGPGQPSRQPLHRSVESDTGCVGIHAPVRGQHTQPPRGRRRTNLDVCDVSANRR